MSKSKKILFMMSGSIAAYKSCDLVSKLVGEGHELKLAMTHSALKFVGKATLEGLTAQEVFCDEYQAGRLMDHIHLVEWADIIVVSPASANTINSMAKGLSTNIISSLFLAYDFSKTFVVFPAMNSKMLKHPATQSSIDSLKEWGLKIADTEDGKLACGEVGKGRLLSTESSMDLLKEYL